MRRLTCFVSFFAFLTLAAAPVSAGPVFTLDPSDGALSGLPGVTLGWGVTIQNDNSGWLVIDSVTYDPCVLCISIGDFSDFLSPQFLSYALAPGDTFTQAFDASTSSGLGSYVIDGSFANPGDEAMGNLDLIYDIFSQDPNSDAYDPSAAIDNQYEASLAATVTYQNGSEAPEPATSATSLIGLAALVLRRAARLRSADREKGGWYTAQNRG